MICYWAQNICYNSTFWEGENFCIPLFLKILYILHFYVLKNGKKNTFSIHLNTFEKKIARCYILVETKTYQNNNSSCILIVINHSIFTVHVQFVKSLFIEMSHEKYVGYILSNDRQLVLYLVSLKKKKITSIYLTKMYNFFLLYWICV